jgi:hypothetical protein
MILKGFVPGSVDGAVSIGVGEAAVSSGVDREISESEAPREE